MNSNIISNQFAENYDKQCLKYGWFSPEILFGLSYEYIKPNQTLLDIGIGTGLSSVLFQKAGLVIYGIDGSEKMLKICTSKEISDNLKKHDIQNIPLPYSDKFFHHISANGVFHLLGDLAPLINQASRLIKADGIFSFTFEKLKPESLNGYNKSNIDGISEKINQKSGIKSYRHSPSYIENLLKINKFILLKKLEFLAFKATPWDKEKYFNAYIMKNITPK